MNPHGLKNVRASAFLFVSSSTKLPTPHLLTLQLFNSKGNPDGKNCVTAKGTKLRETLAFSERNQKADPY